MNYSYFPGCTLKTKGAQLDKAGRLAAEKLGFSLCEIPEWQCCGAVYPQSNDEIATRLASVRALMAARDAGQPLVSLCSACHHVLKRVNGDMQHNDEIRAKVNNYLKPETPYAGETKVLLGQCPQGRCEASHGPEDRRVLRLHAPASEPRDAV